MLEMLLSDLSINAFWICIFSFLNAAHIKNEFERVEIRSYLAQRVISSEFL